MGDQGKREGSPEAEAFSGQVTDSSRRCARMKRKGRSARNPQPRPTTGERSWDGMDKIEG